MKDAMTRVRPLLGSLLAVLLLGGGLARTAGAAPGPCTVDPGLPDPLYVDLQTSLGMIEIELWPDVAPCTVNNFLAYDGGADSFASIVRDPAVVNDPANRISARRSRWPDSAVRSAARRANSSSTWQTTRVSTRRTRALRSPCPDRSDARVF